MSLRLVFEPYYRTRSEEFYFQRRGDMLDLIQLMLSNVSPLLVFGPGPVMREEAN